MISLLLVIRIASWRNWTVPQIFSQTAKKHPKKIMFYFEDQKWTFEDVIAQIKSQRFHEKEVG